MSTSSSLWSSLRGYKRPTATWIPETARSINGPRRPIMLRVAIQGTITDIHRQLGHATSTRQRQPFAVVLCSACRVRTLIKSPTAALRASLQPMAVDKPQIVTNLIIGSSGHMVRGSTFIIARRQDWVDRFSEPTIIHCDRVSAFENQTTRPNYVPCYKSRKQELLLITHKLTKLLHGSTERSSEYCLHLFIAIPVIAGSNTCHSVC
ncbi:unnamed protein product [Dibothriocephalus latus]|uniref:Uncharacterized protein n=1 Tax=Dibothriocephalus latus TaxID=60516 RepID=A0A3P7LMV2_DIBLA|nr:unnamed protein product [Dibothriocephalus latus]